MRKLIRLVMFVGILSGCKKNDTPESTPSTTPIQNNIPTLPPNAKAGLVVVSSKKLILHQGDQAVLSADVYDVSGNPITPSLQWTSAATAIVSTSQGAITAQSLGETIIKVGDEINAEDYVTVSVVADTVVIPGGPANIKFSLPAVNLKTGTQATIPAYTLTDYKGRSVNGTPKFEFVNFDKATIQGNTINAANSPGNGYLIAKMNGVYLNGSLPVTVYSSNAKEITYSFQIKGRYPSVFNYYNETSDPVQLQVTESGSNSSGFYVRYYQTNPDKITVDFPEVIGVNDKGGFTSKRPGTTGITLSFKGSDIKMYSGVNVDMSGSWGGSNNGTSYSFCISKGLTPVIYDAFNLMSSSDQLAGIRAVFNHTAINPVVSGKTNIKYLTTIDKYNGCNVLFGPNCSCNISDVGPFTQTNTNFGQIWLLHGTQYAGVQYTMQWINELDVIQLNNGVKLTRGAGDCKINPDAVLTLSQILSGHTWKPNACMADEIDPTSFHFNNDGTWKAPGLFFTGESPISWSCPDNKTIAIIGMFYDNYGDNGTSNLKKDTLYIYVSAFTQTAIECNDTRNGWGENCNHLLNRQ